MKLYMNYFGISQKDELNSITNEKLGNKLFLTMQQEYPASISILDKILTKWRDSQEYQQHSIAARKLIRKGSLRSDQSQLPFKELRLAQLRKYPEHVIREAEVITGISPCIIVPLAKFDEYVSEDTKVAMVKTVPT